MLKGLNHSKRPYVTILCSIRFMVSPPPFPGVASCQKGPPCGQSLSVFMHLFMAPFLVHCDTWSGVCNHFFLNIDNLVYQTTGSCVFVALGMSSHISLVSTTYPIICENDDLIQQSQCSLINAPIGEATIIPHSHNTFVIEKTKQILRTRMTYVPKQSK